VMREREQLARSGIVLITVSLDKYSNRLLKDPEVLTRGFISPNDSDGLIPAIQKKVSTLVNGGGTDDEKLISDAVRSLLYYETRRKPMVFVVITKA
jgi:ribonuclease J